MKMKLLVVLALLLAACGGTANADNTEGVATLDGSSGSDQTQSTDPGDVDVEQAMIDFTNCMRDQGIEMSDPEVDSDGNVIPGRPQFDTDGPPDEATREKMQSARAACEQYLQGVTLGFQRIDDTEFQDRMLAFAACMREQGIDMPDPDFSGEQRRGRGIFGENFDPQDPDFQAAMEACQDELPGQFGDRPPGGFQGGPPAGGAPDGSTGN